MSSKTKSDKKPSNSVHKKNYIPKSNQTQKKSKDNNQNFKNHKKSYQHSKFMNLEQENEIFNLLINLGNTSNKQNKKEESQSPHKESTRETSSNLPTNNNSKNQTPKTSIDLTSNKNEVPQNNYLLEFSTPSFQKKLIEKTSYRNRKYSSNSNNSAEGNGNDYDELSYHISNPTFNSGSKSSFSNGIPVSNFDLNSKAKADNFKIKYKTELCKYYEINGTCKFGENVRKLLFNF